MSNPIYFDRFGIILNLLESVLEHGFWHQFTKLLILNFFFKILKISNWKIDILGLKSPFSSLIWPKIFKFSGRKSVLKSIKNRGKGQVAELMRNSS